MKETTMKMKRNVKRLAVVLLIGIFLAPAAAFSWDRGHGRHHGKDFGIGMEGHRGCMSRVWKSPKMIKELGLTDEQVAKLKEADFARREKVIDLRAKLEGYKLELEKAFSESALNENRVREIAGQMKDVRGEMFMERIESWLTVKRILTPEQIEKLKEKRMERPRHRKGFGDDDKFGRRGFHGKGNRG